MERFSAGKTPDKIWPAKRSHPSWHPVGIMAHPLLLRLVRNHLYNPSVCSSHNHPDHFDNKHGNFHRLGLLKNKQHMDMPSDPPDPQQHILSHPHKHPDPAEHNPDDHTKCPPGPGHFYKRVQKKIYPPKSLFGNKCWRIAIPSRSRLDFPTRKPSCRPDEPSRPEVGQGEIRGRPPPSPAFPLKKILSYFGTTFHIYRKAQLKGESVWKSGKCPKRINWL